MGYFNLALVTRVFPFACFPLAATFLLVLVVVVFVVSGADVMVGINALGVVLCG